MTITRTENTQFYTATVDGHVVYGLTDFDVPEGATSLSEAEYDVAIAEMEAASRVKRLADEDVLLADIRQAHDDRLSTLLSAVDANGVSMFPEAVARAIVGPRP